MYLIDTNIVIYSSQSAYSYLRELINDAGSSVSDITRLETLGYHQLDKQDLEYFASVFAITTIYPVYPWIVDMAIQLRSQRKMKTGDSLIAGTALAYHLDLYTHNVADFKGIEGLRVVDPLIGPVA